MARNSIEIESFVHLNPIPAATRIGPLIESSVISPYNPGGRELPDSLDEMVANLFLHMGNILEAGQASWDDVAKITFFAEDPAAAKDAVNERWLEKFPDAASRPSRHTVRMPASPAKPRVSCVFTAYVEEPT